MGNLYALPEVHKNNCPVRPIVAAYGSFNFKLGKHLVPLISQLVVKPNILKNSYDFASTLHTLSDANNSFVCSFDITSLYTNIHVAETIDLILDNIYTTGKVYKGISYNLQRYLSWKLLGIITTGCKQYLFLIQW